MPFAPRDSSAWSRLALRGTRSLLMAPVYRVLVGSIGLAYALGAMLFSGMLYIPSRPLPIGLFLYILPAGPGASWTYPAILAGTPYFQVDLPLLSTILMTLTAAGVGLGMALAVLLGIRLIRQRHAGLVRPTAIGSAAGFTPAVIALVTLGACCSTTAAATAGIGLAAQSGVGSAAALLANTWYLGFLQVGIVYLALLAQEHLVGTYGQILGRATSEPSLPEPTPVTAPRTAKGPGFSN